MRYFVEIKSIKRDGTEVLIRHAPDENSEDGAALLAWNLGTAVVSTDVSQHAEILKPFQAVYQFYNCYDNSLCYIYTRAYGDLAQVRPGVFVL